MLDASHFAWAFRHQAFELGSDDEWSAAFLELFLHPLIVGVDCLHRNSARGRIELNYGDVI